MLNAPAVLMEGFTNLGVLGSAALLGAATVSGSLVGAVMANATSKGKQDIRVAQLGYMRDRTLAEVDNQKAKLKEESRNLYSPAKAMRI